MPDLSAEYHVPDESIESLPDRLNEFLDPYYPHFGRIETHGHAHMYVSGRFQRLDRRTLEPIATEHGVHRRPLQMFVGAGKWEDDPVLDLLAEQVADEIGTPGGILILDGSGFQKWGTKSVGVKRQWCGRLGKVENCQVGEFLAYATAKGHTLVDRRIYLPEDWANDSERRAEAHVPEDVSFRKGWELAHEMVLARAAVLPHKWILGDDAYGRISEFRDLLNSDKESYILEVPHNTRARKRGAGKPQTVSSIAASIPKQRWTSVRTRDGEKGPIDVRAIKLRVIAGAKTKQERRRETLLIVRRPSSGEVWYYLSNRKGVSVAKMAKAAACRHYVEQSLQTAKGDAGLAEYEVRSWVGWHHHMTLSLLAMFFLVRERTRLKKTHPR
jgi:SRSO17 transposase